MRTHEKEIIPPKGRNWRIRYRTRAERLHNAAMTVFVSFISIVLWVIQLVMILKNLPKLF